MNKKIAVICGDGIGPEVTKEAVRVLDRICTVYGHRFEYDYIDMGGVSIDKTGEALTDEALERAKKADAVLLGAVGGAKWDKGKVRPEQGLLAIRKGLEVYANLRPSVLFDELRDACPLKAENLPEKLDILIVRELTGGIYFGKSGRLDGGKTAFDTETYSEAEIRRILVMSAEAAMKRRKIVTVVDKANILESSRLWREVASDVFSKYPELTVDYMYVDNASMQLIRDSAHFDVIATSNMFGDILSDEASMLTGSIGMLPSASLGNGTGLYEPIHGSAPDIAGQNIANPCATILAAAMLLDYSFGLKREAQSVENAVKSFLKAGYRTKDIIGSAQGVTCVGTVEAGKIIENNIVG